MFVNNNERMCPGQAIAGRALRALISRRLAVLARDRRRALKRRLLAETRALYALSAALRTGFDLVIPAVKSEERQQPLMTIA